MTSSINWQLENHFIKDLKPLAVNPRAISKEQFQHLQASIAKFGFIDKPIVNQDLAIICGHQRIKVLQKEKIKEVMCWIPDRMLSHDEVMELSIRHNKNTGFFDFEALANNFEVPDLIEWGFSSEELFDEMKPEKEEKEKEEKKRKIVKCPICDAEFMPS